MNSMDLFMAFGDIDENLVFDAGEDGAENLGTSAGIAPVKQPKHNKPPRGGAKTKAIVIGAVAVVLAAAITCLVLYFTGVFGGKQIPIYTGMEISAVNTSADDGSANAVSHKYSGDYTGRNDDVDKDDPYGDGGATIEQQASSTLQVISAGNDIYYADAGDDIYITIKFYNPDWYDIVSFVLSDGTTETHYTSYMFESGSDYENIIIKLNVGTTGGIIEYSISEIKYLDDDSVNSSVIIEGDTVVRCGVRVSDITYATISDETTTLTSISFTAEIVDKYSLISYSGGYAKAILFDGESIVQVIDLEIGTNEVVFDNLTPDTLYQYAVVGYFDNLSGSGAALNYLYKNAVYTPAVVLFDSISISQDSISFGYSWYTGYSGAISSLTLTHGGETQTLDASATSISGLLSNNAYTLTATYNGTSGETASITLDFTTEAKATPSVTISGESTQTEISYAVSVTDTDGVGSLSSVTLSLNGAVVQTLNTATGTFSGLFSNNAYTLTAVYTYNLNDGTGSHTAEATKIITTIAKATPEVEITVTDSTVSTLTYSVNYTDTDGVGKITAIALYNGSTLVKSESNLNQVEYAYSGLEAYTEYTLKVSYSYDLNDGEGSHTAEQTITENTYPSLTISSTTVGNTSAVTEGGTINITANMNNLSGVTFNSVVVNGETYSALGISTASELYVNISNDGQFEGGTTTLVISQITCSIDGKTYTIDISENNTVEVLIYGELTVENFYIARYNSTTEKYEETNYGLANEQLYYVISLGNGTKYNINSITIGGVAYSSSEITLSSDYQMVYIPVYTESVADTVSSITYSYGSDSNKKKSFNVSFGYFRALSSSSAVEITTAEQLLDVDDNAYYILMNDIDVSEYTAEWVNMNNNMYGVFDGNGHTISGLGAVTDYYDSDLYISLFSKVSGIITNLTVSAWYNVSLNNTSSGNYSIYAGGLASTSGELMVDNVNVTFTAAITFDGYVGSNVYVGGIYAGGICGNYGGTYNIVTNSTVKTNISITNKNGDGSEWVEIGGLFGNVSDQPNNILEITDTNVTFTASFTLESKVYELHIGGLVGYADLYDDYVISDVTVNSNVTVDGDSTYSSIYGVVGGADKIYLYNVTSSMTANLSSALANKFLNNQWGYGYGEYGSDGITTDEYCSGTITVNEIS